MATLLRWAVKGLLALASFLLLETGLWGIPENIAKQIAFLTWLNENGVIRAIAFGMFALLFAGAAIGPARLRDWKGSASDWLHARTRRIEQLEREKSEAERQRDALQERVRVLEATPRTEAENLKHNCLQLGTELSRFTEQWAAQYRKVEAREPTNEVQRALKARDMDSIREGARRRYKKRFRARAVRLFELAEAKGWVEPRWKEKAKIAATKDVRFVQEIAEKLCEIGRQP